MHTYMPIWRRKWQPTLVLLPRKSHRRRSLVQAAVHGVAKSRTRLSDFILFAHNTNMNEISVTLEGQAKSFGNKERGTKVILE